MGPFYKYMMMLLTEPSKRKKAKKKESVAPAGPGKLCLHLSAILRTSVTHFIHGEMGFRDNK